MSDDREPNDTPAPLPFTLAEAYGELPGAPVAPTGWLPNLSQDSPSNVPIGQSGGDDPPGSFSLAEAYGDAREPASGAEELPPNGTIPFSSPPSTTLAPMIQTTTVAPASAKRETRDDIERKKQAFIAAHLRDATDIAAQLGVRPAQVLGVAALESAWGNLDHGFVSVGNFFGLHAGSKFQSGTKKAAGDGPMARFNSFRDSARSFAAGTKNVVGASENPQDELAFVTALQKSKKYGINPHDGSPMPEYISGTTSTIRDIQKRLDAASAK